MLFLLVEKREEKRAVGPLVLTLLCAAASVQSLSLFKPEKLYLRELTRFLASLHRFPGDTAASELRTHKLAFLYFSVVH